MLKEHSLQGRRIILVPTGKARSLPWVLEEEAPGPNWGPAKTSWRTLHLNTPLPPIPDDQECCCDLTFYSVSGYILEWVNRAPGAGFSWPLDFSFRASTEVQDAFMTYTVYDDVITMKLIQEACKVLGEDEGGLLGFLRAAVMKYNQFSSPTVVLLSPCQRGVSSPETLL